MHDSDALIVIAEFISDIRTTFSDNVYSLIIKHNS